MEGRLFCSTTDSCSIQALYTLRSMGARTILKRTRKPDHRTNRVCGLDQRWRKKRFAKGQVEVMGRSVGTKTTLDPA